MRWIVLAALATGCYAEHDFVPAKTDAFCAFLLECTDPAVIAFDGMNMEVCQGFWGPRFDEEGDTCRKFTRSVAQDCVAALELATCPEDGSPVSENLPEICSYVYTRCEEPVVEPAEADAI